MGKTFNTEEQSKLRRFSRKIISETEISETSAFPLAGKQQGKLE
jgi:hypothetical protein